MRGEGGKIYQNLADVICERSLCPAEPSREGVKVEHVIVVINHRPKKTVNGIVGWILLLNNKKKCNYSCVDTDSCNP